VTRSLRDFAAALGSTVLSTAQVIHDVFLVREVCGVSCHDWQGHDGGEWQVITCDRHAGHRGGHASKEWGIDATSWWSLSDHGVDGPRCLR
jgi:hypothetical protein